MRDSTGKHGSLHHKKHRGAIVIDVREPNEFRFVQDRRAPGLTETPCDVPFPRFPRFLHKLPAEYPDRSNLEYIPAGPREPLAA